MMLRRFLVATALMLGMALPTGARATTFSFGTIDAGDLIESVVIAPGVQNITFTNLAGAGTGQLKIEGFVSTINFLSGPSLVVNPGDVQFTSIVNVIVPPTLLPTVAVANLTWVPLDFSLVDLVGTGGGPILMFEGDYDGPLGMLITPSGGVVRATMDAALDGFAGGDADFIAAFGQTGALNALAPIANGATLCGIVHNCNANAALRDWVNWSSNPTITLQTNQVPEPGTASLIALGLLGLSLRKRTLRA